MTAPLWLLLAGCTPKGASLDDSAPPADSAELACASLPWYPDSDGDGWGVDEGAVDACEAGEGYAARAGDCDDADPDRRPDADERCNLVDDDCDGLTDDEDGLVSDGSTWYLDGDGDGWAGDTYAVSACEAPEGASAEALDCDDADPATSPEAEDLCNGLDDDCDGVVDPSLDGSSGWTGTYNLSFSGGSMGMAFDITCSGELSVSVWEDEGWSGFAAMPSACCESTLGSCFALTFNLHQHDGGTEAVGEIEWDGADSGDWTGTWSTPSCEAPGWLEASVSATLYPVSYWTYAWAEGSLSLWQE